jgi:hypothetical protein
MQIELPSDEYNTPFGGFPPNLQCFTDWIGCFDEETKNTYETGTWAYNK